MTELLANLRSITIEDLARAHALLSFGLEFGYRQRAAASAADREPIAFGAHLARLQRAGVERFGLPEIQRLAAEAREKARPGLEPAQAIVDLVGRAREVGAAIFFLDDRRMS